MCRNLSISASIITLQTFSNLWASRHLQHFNQNTEVKACTVHSAQLSATFVFILHAVSIMTQMQAALACWASSTILETGEHHTKFRIDFILFLWLVKCRKPVRLNKLCTRTVCLCLYSWLGWGSQFEDVCTTFIETHTDVHLALNKTVLDVNTGFFSNSLPRYKFNQQL